MPTEDSKSRGLFMDAKPGVWQGIGVVSLIIAVIALTMPFLIPAPAGPIGPEGIQGPAGPEGPKGDDGDQGPAVQDLRD